MADASTYATNRANGTAFNAPATTPTTSSSGGGDSTAPAPYVAPAGSVILRGANGSPNYTQSGTLTAQIASGNGTGTNPAPAVMTSKAASTDLTDKQNQISHLNADTTNHNAAIVAGQSAQTPTTPTTPSTTNNGTSTPGASGGDGSLDSQIQEILSGFKTKASDITNAADTTATADEVAAAAAQKQLDDSSTIAFAQLASIQQGTYPLSAPEQAVLSATTGGYQQALLYQQQANSSYTGQMTELMASLGVSTSAPTEAIGLIHEAISTGASKIADLTGQMATSLANIELGFQKQDFDQVQSEWTNLSTYLSNRVTTLTTMQKNVTDAAHQQVADLQSQTQMGLTTMIDSAKFTYQQKQDAISNAFQQQTINETQRHDLATEAATDPGSPAQQDKLFQQGVTDLKSELSNRSGGLGLQDGKVNQAIHLKNLFSQYATTKTVPNTGSAGQSLPGTHTETVYNIPPSAYTELAMGVANLVSGSNNVAEGTVNKIQQATAAGNLGQALTFATGTPFNGSTQAVLQQLKDSVDRQGTTAEGERQTYVNDLIQRLPPGLSDENTQKLIQSSGLNTYYSPKEQVDNYVKSNPDQAESVAKLYEMPGVTDQDVADYLNQAQ